MLERFNNSVPPLAACTVLISLSEKLNLISDLFQFSLTKQIEKN